MDREKFESYVRDNGWEIDLLPGYLRVSKHGTTLHEKFTIAMDFCSLIEKMKSIDFGPQEVQGEFPYAHKDLL